MTTTTKQRPNRPPPNARKYNALPVIEIARQLGMSTREIKAATGWNGKAFREAAAGQYEMRALIADRKAVNVLKMHPAEVWSDWF